MSDSHVTHHGPCSECGSRDNRAHYSDGHTFCFGCRHRTPPDGEIEDNSDREVTRSVSQLPMIPLSELEYTSLNKREIVQETCEKMRYGIARGVYIPKQEETKTCHIACYFDAETSTKLVAQHVRFINDKGEKDFRWFGDQSKVGLFGMNAFRNPGKLCVITEGECDQLSVSQVQDNKWPVYSVPNGAQNAVKDIGRVLDFLEQFEKVVLMFDNDEAGHAAVEEVAAVLSPGKVGVATLPLKDANDMLVAGRGRELIDAIWAGSRNTYRPDGVVTGDALWEAMNKEDVGIALPLPYECVNKLLVGIRPGQILLIPGGTGLGKSTVARDIAMHWHTEYGERCGVIALEESLFDTTCELIDTARSERGAATLTKEELKPLFDEHIADKWVLFDHMGSVEFKVLENRMRYLAKVEGCTTIIFDHILAAVEGSDETNINRAVERAMSKVRALAGELGVRLIMPTHLKSVDDRAFEEGAAVRSCDIKYPALRQYANKILALERNQQNTESTKFKFRVLKNRGDGGQTGPAGAAEWDALTNRIHEVESKNSDLVTEEGVGLDDEDLDEAPF